MQNESSTVDLVSVTPPIRLREASARRAGRRLQGIAHIPRAIFETAPDRYLEAPIAI
jgi:hypothetical protein